MTSTFSFPNFLSKFLSVVSVFIFCEAVLGQPTVTKDSVEWKNPFKPDEVDKAIESGIEFLLSNQKDNGAIYDRGNPTSITALSLMSLAAVGHLPIHPNEKGKAMAKALDYILLDKNQNEVGYFGKDGGRMYGHGIVTSSAEMLNGMMKRQTRQSGKCQMAIDLILRFKKFKIKLSREGDMVDSKDADLSVTIWQLALRSAKNSDSMFLPSRSD